MRNKRNYYRVLHVQPDAPNAVIRSSYRTLMQTLKQHPDLGGEEWNAALINQAYKTLIEPELRAAYDRQLAQRKMSPEFHRDNPDPANRNEQDPKQENKACPFCNRPYLQGAAHNPEALCSGCQSPLFPALRISQHSSCQRAVDRVELHQPLLIHPQESRTKPVSAVLSNLSPHGLQFTCSAQIDPGQIVKIDSQSFAAIAEIVNTATQASKNATHRTIGAQFLTLRFNAMRGTFFSAEA